MSSPRPQADEDAIALLTSSPSLLAKVAAYVGTDADDRYVDWSAIATVAAEGPWSASDRAFLGRDVQFQRRLGMGRPAMTAGGALHRTALRGDLAIVHEIAGGALWTGQDHDGGMGLVTWAVVLERRRPGAVSGSGGSPSGPAPNPARTVTAIPNMRALPKPKSLAAAYRPGRRFARQASGATSLTLGPQGPGRLRTGSAGASSGLRIAGKADAQTAA